MAKVQPKHWAWDEYLAWESQQPARYELVDGDVYAMGGGSVAHDLIANRLRAELAQRLRDGPCRPHGPDVKVATATGNARYPDALIDCGHLVPDALCAQHPVAVFEVLSKSTAWVDQSLKLRDYDATTTIQYYVLIAQDEPRVVVYARSDDGRIDLRGAALLTHIERSIDLPALNLSIPLATLYDGLGFVTEP